MFGGDITELQYDIREWSGLERVEVKTYYPHLYSQLRIFDFKVVEKHDTPLFNGIRRFFDMDSAEPHTTIVHDNSYSATFLDNSSDVEDWDAPESVVEKLEEKGYRVLGLEEVEEQYEKSDLPIGVRSSLRQRERQQERRERLQRKKEKAKGRYPRVEDCKECAGFYALEERPEPTVEGMLLYDGLPLEYQEHEIGCDGRIEPNKRA